MLNLMAESTRVGHACSIVFTACVIISSIYNRRVLGMKSVYVVLFRIVQNLKLQSLFVLLLVHWF